MQAIGVDQAENVSSLRRDQGTDFELAVCDGGSSGRAMWVKR